MKPGPGPSPDNRAGRSLPGRPYPRHTAELSGCRGLLSSQDSARSASSSRQSSTRALVSPDLSGEKRPPRQVASRPHAAPLPTLPPGTPFTAGLPLRPPRVGTPSISELHSRGQTLSSHLHLLHWLPRLTSFHLIFSKAAERPTKGLYSPTTAPTDSPSSQSIANP